jgi:hypothetical protein
MVDIMVVREALRRSRKLEFNSEMNLEKPTVGEDSLISLLIHDIFGGEILKTPKKKGWYFYNRIDGLRIDFTRSESVRYLKNVSFDDIPSAPDETQTYFAKEDYSSFLMRFVRVFEEAVGLEKYRPGIST